MGASRHWEPALNWMRQRGSGRQSIRERPACLLLVSRPEHYKCMTHVAWWQLRWMSPVATVENSLRLHLKSSRWKRLTNDWPVLQDRKILSLSDCLIPVQVQQSFWLTWGTIVIAFLNHFRTWNLAHLDITYNTVPNSHYDAKEVNWGDYGPSPDAWGISLTLSYSQMCFSIACRRTFFLFPTLSLLPHFNPSSFHLPLCLSVPRGTNKDSF